jgi:hypothetical protein
MSGTSPGLQNTLEQAKQTRLNAKKSFPHGLGHYLPFAVTLVQPFERRIHIELWSFTPNDVTAASGCSNRCESDVQLLSRRLA